MSSEQIDRVRSNEPSHPIRALVDHRRGYERSFSSTRIIIHFIIPPQLLLISQRFNHHPVIHGFKDVNRPGPVIKEKKPWSLETLEHVYYILCQESIDHDPETPTRFD